MRAMRGLSLLKILSNYANQNVLALMDLIERVQYKLAPFVSS